MLPLMKLNNAGLITRNWRLFDIVYMICGKYTADRLVIWEEYFRRVKIKRYKRRAEIKLAKSFSWKYWEGLV